MVCEFAAGLVITLYDTAEGKGLSTEIRIEGEATAIFILLPQYYKFVQLSNTKSKLKSNCNWDETVHFVYPFCIWHSLNSFHIFIMIVIRCELLFCKYFVIEEYFN